MTSRLAGGTTAGFASRKGRWIRLELWRPTTGDGARGVEEREAGVPQPRILRRCGGEEADERGAVEASRERGEVPPRGSSRPRRPPPTAPAPRHY
jgi:hypothetical protein